MHVSKHSNFSCITVVTKFGEDTKPKNSSESQILVGPDEQNDVGPLTDFDMTLWTTVGNVGPT